MTNYLLGHWSKKTGQMDDAECPRCGMKEAETPDHIVFRCTNIRRVEDERGTRKWARKEGMRWDNWDALASKKWVRMEMRDPRESGFDGGILRGCPPSDLKIMCSEWFRSLGAVGGGAMDVLYFQPVLNPKSYDGGVRWSLVFLIVMITLRHGRRSRLQL